MCNFWINNWYFSINNYYFWLINMCNLAHVRQILKKNSTFITLICLGSSIFVSIPISPKIIFKTRILLTITLEILVKEEILLYWIQHYIKILITQIPMVLERYQSLVGWFSGDWQLNAELDREDHGSILCNCDREGTEITWCQNWSQIKLN
jgi:hypothetical protein